MMTRTPLLLLLTLVVTVCSGCSRVSTPEEAVVAISSSDEKDRARAMKLLMSLEATEREELALDLFLSDDPGLAWAGMTIFASHEPTPVCWELIESSIGRYEIARRYAHIASVHGRDRRLDRLAAAIAEAPAHDRGFLLKAISTISGQLEPPSPAWSARLLSYRWKLFVERKAAGNTDPRLEEALTMLYAAERPTAFPEAVRHIPSSAVVEAEADLMALLDEAPVDLGRELAIYLGECKGSAALRLLFRLAESDDYITRFSVHASLEMLIHSQVPFDPAASPAERKRAIDELRQLAPLRILDITNAP